MRSVRLEVALLFTSGILAAGCKPAWPKCSADKECNEDGHHGVCVDGSCQECAKDGDCPKNFVCRGNKCLPKPECTTDSDCTAPKICRGEKCLLECTGDAECGMGQNCMANRCVTKAAPPQCTVDADCASGQKCSGGACIVAGQCQLEPVHFAYNEALLDETAKAILARDHDCLKTRPGKVHLRLEGNCDSRGTEEYNLHLGQRRADAVLKYLLNLGVPHQEMKTISFGKDKPICNEESESCWAQNRRTDLLEK